LTFLTGTGRHRAQIAHFFRGQNGSWSPLGVGLIVGKRLYRIRRRCGSLVVSEGSGSKPHGHLPTDLRNRRNLARGGYSSSPVLDLQGQARRRHSFGEFLHRRWRRARATGGERQGRGSRWGPVVLDSTSRRPTRCPPLGPPPPEIVFGRPPGTAPRGTRRARAQSNLQRR
jgi:hypothetical protein